MIVTDPSAEGSSNGGITISGVGLVSFPLVALPVSFVSVVFSIGFTGALFTFKLPFVANEEYLLSPEYLIIYG